MQATVHHISELWTAVEAGAAPFVPGGAFWPLTRTALLFLFIIATLFAILLLYGGDVQNTNIGPISVRPRALATSTFFAAPRSIVTPSLEGKTIHCTFVLQYQDRRARPQFKNLTKPRKVKLKLSALNKRMGFIRADLFGFWNPNYAQLLQDRFTEADIPTGAEDQGFYSREPPNDAGLLDMQSDELEFVTVSPALWSQLAQSHRDVMSKGMARFQRFNRHRGKRSFEKAPEYLELPDYAQPANLYVRFHFTANPLNHPDPQVKTTAWLTVLTSLFALLTQWLYVGF
jgi:hypothetical protein